MTDRLKRDFTASAVPTMRSSDFANLVVIGGEVDELARARHGDHRHPIFRRQRVDELLRAVHRAARGAGADVALIDQQDDQAVRSARLWRWTRRRSRRATTTLRGAPITRSGSAERSIRPSTTCRLVAVDLDVELRGGEVGDLAAVVVERGDVDARPARRRRERQGAWGAWVPGVPGPPVAARSRGRRLRRAGPLA